MKINKITVYLLTLLIIIILAITVVIFNYTRLDKIEIKEKVNETPKIESNVKENITTKKREELDIVHEYMINEKEEIAACASDYAMGKIALQMYKSSDGGKTFKLVTENFIEVNAKAEYVFLNENICFISNPLNGGDNAELIMTKDGGKTFNVVTFEAQKLEEDNGVKLEWEEVYDYYELPIVDKNIITVYVSEGADCDYKGGNTAAKYVSTDMGNTFTFKEIVQREKTE